MNNGSGLGPYHSEDDFDEVRPSPSSQYFTPSSSSAAGSMAASSVGLGPTSLGGVAGGSQGQQAPLSSFGSGSQGSSLSGSRATSGNICCLLEDGRRCQRTAGNASYSKRVQKTVFYKRLRLDVDNTAQHTYICDYHKNVIQTARVRMKKEKDSDDEGVPNDNDDIDVDLYQLQVNTLRRYKKHFKIPTRPGLNKAQLAEILTKNFKTIPVNEKEIVTYFIYSIKSGKNKLDNRQPEGSAPNDYLERY